jgi:DNA-binding response OmpR family regulator
MFTNNLSTYVYIAAEVLFNLRGKAMSSGLIIIAEDNATQRKLYCEFLESRGFTVVAANNGHEALALLQTLRPKVLILDVMMPELDGIETCRRVREQLGTSLPIVFLTAADELDKLDDCMRAGGNDYLIKTASLEHILARISYWARPTSIWSNEQRRKQVLAAVKKAVIEEETRGQDRRTELTSKTDDTVRQMSAFVMAAQAQAPRGFRLDRRAKALFAWLRYGRGGSLGENETVDAPALSRLPAFGAERDWPPMRNWPIRRSSG